MSILTLIKDVTYIKSNHSHNTGVTCSNMNNPPLIKIKKKQNSNTKQYQQLDIKGISFSFHTLLNSKILKILLIISIPSFTVVLDRNNTSSSNVIKIHSAYIPSFYSAIK